MINTPNHYHCRGNFIITLSAQAVSECGGLFSEHTESWGGEEADGLSTRSMHLQGFLSSTVHLCVCVLYRSSYLNCFFLFIIYYDMYYIIHNGPLAQKIQVLFFLINYGSFSFKVFWGKFDTRLSILWCFSGVAIITLLVFPRDPRHVWNC